MRLTVCTHSPFLSICAPFQPCCGVFSLPFILSKGGYLCSCALDLSSFQSAVAE